MRNTACVLLSVVFFCLPTRGADRVNRPNIVFILADDLGYGDLGCYGRRDIKTPAIDALASEGVRFSQYYANGPECSPTRAAFLNGALSTPSRRFGMCDWYRQCRPLR